MGFLKRALSTSSSWNPVLVAAHVTFTNSVEDAVLIELSREFGAPKDRIEELEVSPYEIVFALWVTADEQKDGQRQARIRDLIQRIESIVGVRSCIVQHESIYFVNSADECIEVQCTSKWHQPAIQGVNLSNNTMKIFSEGDYDAWCFICYDPQNPFQGFSCRTAQRYWKKSLAQPGLSVFSVDSEENIRKGCQQFTTLSKMVAEWGHPRHYFMLIPKGVDNLYPLLLHIDGRNVADIEAHCPPAFKYSIVSSPMQTDRFIGYANEAGETGGSISESSVSSDDLWVAQQSEARPRLRRRSSMSFRGFW